MKDQPWHELGTLHFEEFEKEKNANKKRYLFIVSLAEVKSGVVFFLRKVCVDSRLMMMVCHIHWCALYSTYRLFYKTYWYTLISMYTDCCFKQKRYYYAYYIKAFCVVKDNVIHVGTGTYIV